MKKLLSLLIICSILLCKTGLAQDAESLVQSVRARLEKIDHYEADALLKTEIPYLKVPDAQVKVFYKRPDQIRIVNEKGISLVPRGSVNISLYSLLSSPHQALDAGKGECREIPVRIVKLLPTDEKSDLVLATLFIEPKSLEVLRALITTRDNGTHTLEFYYGKNQVNDLPEKILFSFNTENFKLPKGVTFDYDDGKEKAKGPVSRRGKLEITFLKYRF